MRYNIPMADNPENHTLEMLRRLRTEQNARFDRVDTTLAEVLTQLRIDCWRHLIDERDI